MRFLCTTLLVAVFSVAFAGEPHARLSARQRQTIDAFVAIEMKRQRIPGLAVGIYRSGTVLLAKGYGVANVEHGVPVKAETIFQSGSVGKQFVAAAVMTLVEKGAVSLDDPITKYFPEGPVEWQAIRVEHLLSHTSGLAEYETPERSGEGGAFYLRLDFTEDELVRRVAALPIEAAPEAKWDYRNTNYLLLGILIHRVTGMPYGDYLARNIFEPLGMSSTRLISDADIVPNRAAGYELKDDVLKNQDWVSPTFNARATERSTSTCSTSRAGATRSITRACSGNPASIGSGPSIRSPTVVPIPRATASVGSSASRTRTAASSMGVRGKASRRIFRAIPTTR